MKTLLLILTLLLTSCYSETEIPVIPNCDCGIVQDKWITTGNLYLIQVENECTFNIVATPHSEAVYTSYEINDRICDSYSHVFNF